MTAFLGLRVCGEATPVFATWSKSSRLSEPPNQSVKSKDAQPLRHDGFPGQAQRYPTLILTIDDHSRKILAATFTPSDTTWSHFQHFRLAFETYGMPACIYTDGLSLFGHTSTADRLDTHSQFQRALTALGVARGS